jgi:PhnB protein
MSQATKTGKAAERSKKTKSTSTAKRPETVQPIPPGFHSVTPYLTVNNAAAAIEFYTKAFGAKEVQVHKTPDGKILNAQIKVGDSMVMLSDEFPGSDVRSPLSIGASTVTLHIYTVNVDKLWEMAIAAGARITMPLGNQFWGERYGQLVDPFGHRWSVSQQIKMSEEEMEALQKAAMEMFAQSEHPAKEKEAPPSGVA